MFPDTRIGLLVFDWDGTLMDSSNKIVNCFNGAAGDCGMPKPDAEAVTRLIGLNLSHMFHSLYPDADDKLLDDLVESYRSFWLGRDQTPMPLFPGVEQGLQKLQQAGYLLAVATGKSRRGLERAMVETGLASLFAHSRCADESRSKPDPRMLFDILHASGQVASESIMIGDTSFDMEMARNAGMWAVGVGYGYHPTHELALHADAPIAHSFDQLVELLVFNGE